MRGTGRGEPSSCFVTSSSTVTLARICLFSGKLTLSFVTYLDTRVTPAAVSSMIFLKSAFVSSLLIIHVAFKMWINIGKNMAYILLILTGRKQYQYIPILSGLAGCPIYHIFQYLVHR